MRLLCFAALLAAGCYGALENEDKLQATIAKAEGTAKVECSDLAGGGCVLNGEGVEALTEWCWWNDCGGMCCTDGWDGDCVQCTCCGESIWPICRTSCGTSGWYCGSKK